jgi:uncharacterized protein
VATRLAIISDTHLPRGARRLPDACIARLRAADRILHAGDLVALSVLEELRSLGPPVDGVYGNVDEPAVRAALPSSRMVVVAGRRIAMVHDGGPSRGRLERLRRRFPDADAVVFGHSHLPLHERDDALALQIFNPGSPTDRRRHPVHTMGEATVGAGGVRFALVELGA